MDIAPWLSQLRKGAAELAVLAALDSKDLYGLELLEVVNSQQDLVSEGAIYPLLSRLEKEGKLMSRWELEDSSHPRKYYRLTKDGRALLIAMRAAWTDFRKAMSTLVELRDEP